MRIIEGPNLEVNMVDLNQPAPEMEEVKRRLRMGDDQMKKGYPKAGESLLDYLVYCHNMLELGKIGGKMIR